jgi:hypothetical protein
MLPLQLTDEEELASSATARGICSRKGVGQIMSFASYTTKCKTWPVISSIILVHYSCVELFEDFFWPS